MEEEYKSVVQHQRRLNPNMQDVVKKEVIKLLDAGLIYPISDSPWVSPVQVVPKKGGMTVVMNEKDELIPMRTITGWRVCIDYRKLNDAKRKDHFSLPFIDQMLERLSGKMFYCFLDGFFGYFQIPIAPEDQEKITFTCPYGTFAYRRMPFGLCNAPATFQRCMVAIFHEMIEHSMEVFVDDFSVFGDSFNHCLKNLDKMLARCEEVNLVLNWEKCHFMVKEGIVLGYKISQNGLEVDKAKIETISKLPHPTSVKAIRSFLGHAVIYRCFIKDFSKIARPMTKLLEKDAPYMAEYDDDIHAFLVFPGRDTRDRRAQERLTYLNRRHPEANFYSCKDTLKHVNQWNRYKNIVRGPWKRVLGQRGEAITELTKEFLVSFQIKTKKPDMWDEDAIEFRCGGEWRTTSFTQLGINLGIYTEEETNQEISFKAGITFADENGDDIDEAGNTRLEAWEQLSYGTDNYNASVSKSTALRYPLMRYIHRLLSHSVTARGQREGVVNLKDLWALFCMKNDVPFNITYLFCKLFTTNANARGNTPIFGGPGSTTSMKLMM
ncbi:uncharacterized protein LOC143620357 [Bidens hawaiensis]|uniref:uncharacterized protein LOC143620357 n=1 Tax=Bidens hawaiensis TaxID=980011 RepID=UPI0040493C10